MSNTQGALPRQRIFEMIDSGLITGVAKESLVNPASLDLTLSDEIYRMKGVFFPRAGEKIRDVIKTLSAVPYDLSRPIERGVQYLVRLKQGFSLPSVVYSYCNPKSTTGRNDLHVRVMADGVQSFDAMAPAGFSGEAWVLITPKSFPVILPADEPVCQARFFFADTRLNEFELQNQYAKHQLIFSLLGEPVDYAEVQNPYKDGSILLTLDLSQDIVGYVCQGTSDILDFSKGKGSHDPVGFFEPISRPENGYLHLRQGCFYILSTAEAVHVPPELACEMVDMDSRNGEFRAHYAGYIDPGWGHGKDGKGKGRPLTLEVRPFEDSFIRHGQPVARVRFEVMSEVPDEHYDCRAVPSNYTVQTGPKLSKHFKIV